MFLTNVCGQKQWWWSGQVNCQVLNESHSALYLQKSQWDAGRAAESLH